MTERLLVLVLVFTICTLIFWRMWDDIAQAAEPDYVAFLDDEGLDEVALPACWRSSDVWDTLAAIESLPEVAHA